MPECPICTEEFADADCVELSCGHQACASCGWRIAATTRRCWFCNQPFDAVNGSVDLPEISSENNEATENGREFLLATGIDAFPLVFLVDKKTAVVSFLTGVYIAWLVGWGDTCVSAATS